jgi:hypothetical protein
MRSRIPAWILVLVLAVLGAAGAPDAAAGDPEFGSLTPFCGSCV